jgi:hypothetical protein
LWRIAVKGKSTMVTVNLSEQDIMRLHVIELDRDETAALAFIRERLLPEVQRQAGQKMRSHLDGGKGSLL